MQNKKNKTWKPDRPVSKGASSYHEAVIKTSWHRENIEPLIQALKRKVKNGETVVDFGAGTGASAVYFINHLKKKFQLLLVDNSPSWLGKAYELFKKKSNVDFFILEKTPKGYAQLHEVIGVNVADHVVSANTVHLIPEIETAFQGVFSALKEGGSFIFQSGNIKRNKREKGLLMIDDSVKMVHDKALEILKKEKKFAKYTKGLLKRIIEERSQRKLVFPDPRELEYYISILTSIGFKNTKVSYIKIKVSYKDWLSFLRVRRLQAGILPEVGGKDASSQEAKDRDNLITQAAKEVFKKLEKENKHANSRNFTAEWVYVETTKL